MRIKKKIDKLYVRTRSVVGKMLLSDNNKGMGVIEVILIIIVLIGLAVIFRTNITSIVNSLFNKITTKVNTF